MSDIKKILTIIVDEKGYGQYKLYIREIDSTHVFMSTESHDTDKGSIYHIGQLSHRPFYDDLNKWLHNEIEGYSIMYKSYME